MKASWTLALTISIAFAQVKLKVVATDHAGHPVTDLQPSDLRVIDDGSPQSITSLRLDQSNIASTVSVLLDLMDLSFQQRNAAANQLREALGSVEASVPFHLYLLVSNGGLYPVQGIGPQLDQALQKVSGVRPLDIRADPVERFKTIYSALDSMSQELVRFPGPKQLLWITYGIPSSMKMVGGLMDLKPRLLQLAAQFNRGDIAVYTLDPDLILGTLNRDGLEVLSAATGGRAFSSSDLKMALKQMGTDTSATYLLDYSPSQAKKAEGAFHTVRLSSNRISRAQSDWKILSDYQFVVPEYSGRIWFDRSSNRVLRIERAAEGIPSAFPLRGVEGDVTFGEIKSGSSDTYLLPLQAETRVCIRDRQECSRKTIDFRDYRKFTAESKIREQ